MSIEKYPGSPFHAPDPDRASFCIFPNEAVQNPDILIPEEYRAIGYVRFLCNGSTGRIYRITGLNTEYILKAIPCGENEQNYQNAIHEISITQQVSGLPSVVPLLSWSIHGSGDQKTFYLLEPYLIPLGTYLSGRSLSASSVIHIILEISTALISCRDAGVLHLDLKPDNIYVEADSSQEIPSVRIGDFSSSLWLSERFFNHQMRGTLDYIAPEVYRTGACSEQSEIYSLGLLLYTFLNNGFLPFMPGLKETAIYKRLAGTPLPRDFFFDPAGFYPVIAKACAFQAADRYQSFEALNEDLSGLLCQMQKEYIDWSVYFPSDPLSAIAQTGSPASPSQHPIPSLQTPFPAEQNDLLYADMEPDFSFDPPSCSDSMPLSEQAPILPPFPMPDPLEDEAPWEDRWKTECSGSDWDDNGPADHPSIKEGSAPPPISFPDLGNEVPASAKESASKDDPDARLPFCCIIPSALPLDRVEFSAVSPQRIRSGAAALIHILIYEPEYRYIVSDLLSEYEGNVRESRGGIYKIQEEARIRIVLSSPDIEIEDNREERIWYGGYLNIPFDIYVPSDYHKSEISFKAIVFVNDTVATKLKFQISCKVPREQCVKIMHEEVFSAFVSYASQDRSRVATIIQGMEKARPDWDIFFDVRNIRSGSDWESILPQEIDNRDLLFLCWSHFAKESEWVSKEWHYALKKKGIEMIEPIPLEPPNECPPPDELKSKHFNDSILYFIEQKVQKA